MDGLVSVGDSALTGGIACRTSTAVLVPDSEDVAYTTPWGDGCRRVDGGVVEMIHIWLPGLAPFECS